MRLMVTSPQTSITCRSIFSGAQLRRAYLDFFARDFRAQDPGRREGELVALPHTEVASAPLIPPDDPTLLFTSAGMVQFKRLYSGEIERLPYRRATTCQKCLRAGGKGSDLENVGKTLRHHTFFEMLGNFSFGDYFKAEAVRAAWEFCTSPRYMGLPADRIFATVYGPTAEKPDIPTDGEARAAWIDETADLARRGVVPAGLVNPVITLDEKENFWGPAGDAGACGPCSEIKFFIGTAAELKEAQALGARDPHALGRRIVDEGDRFLEIWNMVFPQFNQQRDGARPPLKNRGIDTGAGLERMTVALSWWHEGGKVNTPYETDLLWPIVEEASRVTGIPYVRVADSTGDPAEARNRLAINAITDHVRALVFCLAEGITPSNDGRGYVVRRIQRRALRIAKLAGVGEPFMHKLVNVVVNCAAWRDPVTGEHIYPEITRNLDATKRTIRLEEERFLRTLDQGLRILDDVVEAAKAGKRAAVGGEDVFLLHATYGFPPDLTREIVEDAGLAFDKAGYDAAMQRHQEEARKSWKGAALGDEAGLLEAVEEEFGRTRFSGYDYESLGREAAFLIGRATPIVAILRGGALVEEADAGLESKDGNAISVVLEETPFYAESGGQVGDTGEIVLADTNDSSSGALRFVVEDTQKTPNDMFLHRGRLVAGTLRKGTLVVPKVDRPRREAIMRNHSVTHLMQGALRRVLGEHIRQSGSWVGPETLRFDFTNMEAVGRAALDQVERIVNEQIARDLPVTTDVLALDEARKRGAIAPFGEKYGPTVRVVQMGEFSVEFCGGTHLRRTSEALRFRILGESSIAAGIRRIEAAAGLAAYAHEIEDRRVLDAITQLVQARGDEAVERIEAMSARVKDLEKEISRLKQTQGAARIDQFVANAHELPGGARLVVGELPGVDGKDLRVLAAQARQKVGDNAVVLFGSAADDKVALICLSGPGAEKRYPANKVIGPIAEMVGGKGGGKSDMAQAGGKNPAALGQALAEAGVKIAAMGG